MDLTGYTVERPLSPKTFSVRLIPPCLPTLMHRGFAELCRAHGFEALCHFCHLCHRDLRSHNLSDIQSNHFNKDIPQVSNLANTRDHIQHRTAKAHGSRTPPTWARLIMDLPIQRLETSLHFRTRQHAAGEGSFDCDSDGWHVQNKITDARHRLTPSKWLLQKKDSKRQVSNEQLHLVLLFFYLCPCPLAITQTTLWKCR